MRFMYVIYVILIITLIVLLIGFLPVKQAIQQDSLNKTESYIIVNIQKSTISEWIAVGDNKGNYDTPKNVRLTGNAPSDYSYGVEFGRNMFICYGKFNGVGDLYGEKYDVFDVKEWEILYPVKRDSLFDWILPNSYLCRFDTK